MNTMAVHIIGGGLAGSEAAHLLSKNGIPVVLHEMRPKTTTPAHKTGACAELVCSNSLKSKNPISAPGMLKAEMDVVGSLILTAARVAEVPGGEALAVDRDVFSDYVTTALRNEPLITIEEGEVTAPVNDSIHLIATGPLTSPSLGNWLVRSTGETDLYFYDAIAPIIDAASIDREKVFLANRYDKGELKAYLNCPMGREEYYAFVDALLTGEKVPAKNFEKEKFFQGCQPIEAIADSGRESLRFGPMKPVGLVDPKTGKHPYAAVQLRPENRALTAYNLVGFQTKLKYGAQIKAIRMIPGLENAEFLRLGSIHRNTYVCGPRVLRSDLSLKGNPKTYLAGQITGVEGYLESAACGMLAAIFILQRIQDRIHSAPPASTALGALLRHVTASDPKNYQPGNIHFGLFDPAFFDLSEVQGRDPTREAMATQAIVHFKDWFKKSGMLQVVPNTRHHLPLPEEESSADQKRGLIV